MALQGFQARIFPALPGDARGDAPHGKRVLSPVLPTGAEPKHIERITGLSPRCGLRERGQDVAASTLNMFLGNEGG